MTRRITLVAIAALASILLMSFSMAVSVATTRPGLAMAIAPYLARPKARLAEVMLAAGLQSGQTDEARALAREALLLDPFDATALRTLGFTYRNREDHAQADALFAYGNRLTRRDLGIGVDHVMEAAKRRDVDTVVRYFDLGLRTNRGSWDTLFPLIYQASADPVIVPPLAAVLAKDPQWKWPFLDGLVRQGPSPLVTASLVSELEKRGPLANDDLHKALIARLLDGGHYTEAVERYRRLAASKGLETLTNGDFERPPLGVPFEWTMLGDGPLDVGTAANATSQTQGTSLYFRVPPSANGELLRLVAVVEPGGHDLSLILGPALEGAPGVLTLETQCLSTGAELDKTVIERPTVGKRTLRFTTPAACRGVRLILAAASLDDQNAWVSWIDDIALGTTGPRG